MLKQEKSKIDVASSFFLLVISFIALWQTRGLSEMSSIFPRTVAFALLLLSCMYFFSSIRAKSSPRYFAHVNRRKVMFISSGMAAYVVLIYSLGFLLASLLYLLTITWILQREERRKAGLRMFMKAVSYSAGTSITFYLLFRYVLAVPLPEGLLGWF